MTNVEVIQHIIDDYIEEEKEIDIALQNILKARNNVRNNKSIVYELLTSLTGEEYDLFLDDDIE